MGYELNKIDYIEAIQIPTRIGKNNVKKFGFSEEEYEELVHFKKTDVQIQIRLIICVNNILKVENISIKKANSDADYNQVDKRWVNSYQDMWHFDDEIALALKLFTGEVSPSSYQEMLKINISKLREHRRVFLTELKDEVIQKILLFFTENKILVVSDILKGRGGFAADWMLVTRYNRACDTTTWILKDINTVMNFWARRCKGLSKRESLYWGNNHAEKRGNSRSY